MEEKKYETVIVLNSSRFGSGNPRLGESLMKDFLDCLSKADPKPDALLLYNTAATLASKDSPVLEEMKKLVADLKAAGIKYTKTTEQVVVITEG